jgi:hypothetical protein
MIIPDRNVPNFWTATRVLDVLLVVPAALASAVTMCLSLFGRPTKNRSTLSPSLFRRRRTGAPDGLTINPLSEFARGSGGGKFTTADTVIKISWSVRPIPVESRHSRDRIAILGGLRHSRSFQV